MFATGLGSEGPMYVVLLACGFSFVWFVCFVAAGIIVLVKARPKLRWLGCVLCTLAFVVPVGCYLAPGIAFRQQYGRDPLPRYPTGVIDKGMTKEQVRAKLGEPHSTFEGGDQDCWYYYTDSIGIGYFGVYFDATGLVDGTGGD